MSENMHDNKRKLPYIEEEEGGERGGIQLRTELDPELADKLHYIKRVLGIRKNSEVIRYLIIEKYEKLITGSFEKK